MSSKKEKKFVDEIFNKIKELHNDYDYKYMGIRCDNRKYKIGDILEWNSKHTIAGKEVKGMKGVTAINVSRYNPNNIIKWNIKRDLSYSIPYDDVNKDEDPYNYIYILGSDKANKTKKYLTTLEKEVNEIRLIEPEVLAVFHKNLTLEDYGINFEDVKEYFINNILDAVLFYFEIEFYGDFPFDEYNDIIEIVKEKDKEIKDKTALKKIWKKVNKILDVDEKNFMYKDHYQFKRITNFEYLWNETLGDIFHDKITSVSDYYDGFFSNKYILPPYFVDIKEEQE